MVEEGREWIAHQNSRAHKGMASKARREDGTGGIAETENGMIKLI